MDRVLEQLSRRGSELPKTCVVFSPWNSTACRLNTNRRNAQNRNSVASTAPTTLAATLSAITEDQSKTLRVIHRQAIGITNEAKLTIA